MRIHCLQHLKNDTLGNIGTWIARKGHKLTKTMLFEDSHFPDPDEFDLLLIMGGTMSVYQEEEYPWLKPEKKFVRTVLELGNPVFGSCFGGQIIADVLGGKITRNQYKEIGWHTVRSIEGEDQKDVRNLRLPSCMYPEFTGFMWHGDTFEIPIGAMKLFESEACPDPATRSRRPGRECCPGAGPRGRSGRPPPA